MNFPEKPQVQDPLIPAADVCRMCGGVTSMSLWRWLNNPSLNFPRPRLIGRRRYWRQSEIHTWIETRPQQVA